MSTRTKQHDTLLQRRIVHRSTQAVVASFLLLTISLCQGCSSRAPSTMSKAHDDRVFRGLTEQADVQGTPKLVIDKTTYDLGQIKPGGKSTAIFRLGRTRVTS
jgi:hypothetical protein